VASLLFLSKAGLSLWLLVYTLLGGLTILATETAAGHNKLEEDAQVNFNFQLLIQRDTRFSDGCFSKISGVGEFNFLSWNTINTFFYIKTRKKIISLCLYKFSVTFQQPTVAWCSQLKRTTERPGEKQASPNKNSSPQHRRGFKKLTRKSLKLDL